MKPSQVVLTTSFKTNLEILENMADLGNIKIGQKIQAIVEYEVIEKTKSYVVLRINGFFLKISRRIF